MHLAESRRIGWRGFGGHHMIGTAAPRDRPEQAAKQAVPLDTFKPYVPSKRVAPPPALSLEDARAIAMKAVVFIAADDELLPRFVQLTGGGVDEIRQGVADALFLNRCRGEALVLTGAILGQANPRSTAIYAHVQNDPSMRAADRVTKKIADALAGKFADGKKRSNRAAF
jgi:hypothetical protein